MNSYSLLVCSTIYVYNITNKCGLLSSYPQWGRWWGRRSRSRTSGGWRWGSSPTRKRHPHPSPTNPRSGNKLCRPREIYILMYRVCIKYCIFFQEFSKVCDLSLASTQLLSVVQKNHQPKGVTVHSHCVESFEGQRCRRGRGCSELWKKTNFFPEHPLCKYTNKLCSVA